MTPHKHAELIKAWADGAKIQWKHDGYTDWQDTIKPDWNPDANYRIKPEPKPDVVQLFFVDKTEPHQVWASFQCETCEHLNLKLTFDGKTGELKSAEVLK